MATSKKKTSAKSKSQFIGRDSIPWRYCLLTLACGAVLVAGFFFAARQHFSSIDFGIKNSKLRKQIEDLESDKRRLILAKEIALSPAEIKKAAKKIGLTEMTASNIEVYRAPVKEKSKTEKLIVEKPKLEFLEKTATENKSDKKSEPKVEKKSPEPKEKTEKSRTQLAKK